ncbi:MAG: biotin--[acetyl-CoA-carboxylase] ligase [Desulfuromonas sp.]|nr:MAG: biotin--[acetyl-CoA-carboxylase] ligase [Desulfuromonas sp.]
MAGSETRSEILHLLQQSDRGYVSGGELCRALGVSRAAVWKQIEQLRQVGYVIEAVPSRGYCLTSSPDHIDRVTLKQALADCRLDWDPCFVENIPSTNAYAAELAEKGGREGTVVLAEQQSAGKGRLGRHWTSPPGVNLYVSMVLRPSIPPRDAPQLTFLSSVAVARAVKEVTGLEPKVKWPNDILIAGKKVAGLLNEMSAETEGVHHVILGIGLNVNMTQEQFPEDLRYPATSLALAAGRSFPRQALLVALLRHLDALYGLYQHEGAAPIVSAWESWFDLVGERIEVASDETFQGTVLGLAEDGALLVRRDNGCSERVLAGDVRPVVGRYP